MATTPDARRSSAGRWRAAALGRAARAVAATLALLTLLSGCALWEARTAPYIALQVCRNQIDAHFPDLADRLVNDAVMAAEEWFVGGGAHVRLYYAGALPASHPSCADVPNLVEPRLQGTPPAGPRPPDRTVVITAAHSLTYRLAVPSTGRCAFVAVDRWETSGSPLLFGSTPQAVRVTLARHQTCTGTVDPWPWAGAPPTGPAGTLDPLRVLMKSLGHALGLDEVQPPARSVLNPIDAAVHVPLRHLTEGDVQALRRAYGPSQSSPYWLQTRDGGASWTIRASTPRQNSRDSLGAAGCRVASGPQAAQERYLIAETVHQPNGRSVVVTYLVDVQGAMLGSPVAHAESNRKPSALCLSTGFLVGWAAPDGIAAVVRSADAAQWVPATLPAGWRSTHAPALAGAAWDGAVLAAGSDDFAGLRFLRSSDGGATFVDAGAAAPNRQFFNPFGFSCAEALRKCFVLGGDFGFERLAYELNAGQWRGIGTSGGGGIGEVPNLGVATTPTTDGSGFALVRRYKPGSRYYSTPGAALGQIGGGVQPRGDGAFQFLSQPFARAVSDSPPGLLRTVDTPGFIALATFNHLYNSPYVLVPAPGP